MARKKKKKTRLTVAVGLIAIICTAAFYAYERYFHPVALKNKAYVYFFVRHGEDLHDIASSLESEGIVIDGAAFEWLAKQMKLQQNIHPGRYRITNGMGIRHIVNLLKYNRQELVKLNYNQQIHNLDEFVAYTDDKLELDSDDLEDFLTDGERLHAQFGVDPAAAFAIIQPGTYEVSWAVTANELFARLRDEYNRTWTPARVLQARKLGFSPAEITTMASIVQSESGIASEQRKIAGVYINRMKKQMPLQADPTLKFANKTYDAQRVLEADKRIDSPYNTYMYKGLPPGPICLVSRRAIDATLNYERHDFLYFCAMPQLNGYSCYSKDYRQHQVHAAAYRKALDRLGIGR